MGTFHHDKGELHGITVVVDTTGDVVYVGRCDTLMPTGVVLLDVDVHRDGDGGLTKDAYVARAARVGVWKKHDRLVVPSDEVATIRRLADIGR